MIKNQNLTDLPPAGTKITEKKLWVTPSIEIIANAEIANGSSSGGSEGQHTFLYNIFHGRYKS